MRRGTLEVEGIAAIADPSDVVIGGAVSGMASSMGPTYLILKATCGSYIQAAGSSGRYVVEARDVYGEGFLHWRAATAATAGESTATVLFRNRCPQRAHPHRGCPLIVAATQVVGLDVVRRAVLHYAASGERWSGFSWHDVSASFLGQGGGDEVRRIVPRGRNAR